MPPKLDLSTIASAGTSQAMLSSLSLRRSLPPTSVREPPPEENATRAGLDPNGLGDHARREQPNQRMAAPGFLERIARCTRGHHEGT